ncbi:hypothetical protein BFP97_07225 [Roseivirga sp. 4D4]|nr:hypothetical protein BFP97_07225 [Roseivirga sp. 4D4]
MGAITSTGAFSTHNSNQSLLNTRRNKSFLHKGSVKRFEHSNLKLKLSKTSSSRAAKFKAWLRKDNAQERKIDLLILLVSVLIVKVGLMAIA